MKKSMIIVAALATAGAVQAAVIVNWQSSGDAGPAAGSADESSVSTLGTLVYAYNFGATDTLAANTVTFEGTSTGAPASVGGGNITFVNTDNGTSAGFNNLTSNLGTVLDSARWAPRTTEGETVQLNNLTPNQVYMVQLYTSDTRAGRSNTVVLDIGDANEFTVGDNGTGGGTTGTGLYAIGTFTADATGSAEFSRSHDGVYGNANLNALQVRAIPEPATLGLITAFGGGLFFIRRRFMI